MNTKRYRISKKGKIVVFAFILIVFIAIFSHLNSFFNHNFPNIGEVVNQNDKNQDIGEMHNNDTDDNQYDSNIDDNQQDDKNIKEYTLSLYFEPGDTLLNTESQRLLDLFVEMELLEDSKIRIEGNCATLHKTALSDYEREINIAFALKRAKEVVHYLQKKEVPMQRMDVISNGSDNSVNSNKTWSERKLNRRVDIIFQMVK